MKYKNILLKTAICSIACDGDIADEEIMQLKNYEEKSPYFNTNDLSEYLDLELKKCTSDVDAYIEELLNSIEISHLSITEKLQLLELSIKIIEADEKILKEEIAFIKSLKRILLIPEFLLNEKFGVIDYLKADDSEFSGTADDEFEEK